MEFKNPQEDIERFKRRVVVAGAFVVACLLILFARLVWLQAIQHEHYQTRAEGNHIALVPIAPNRGLIVDRNGVVLARNYAAYTLEITPSRVRDLDATLDALAEFILIEPKDRRRFRKLMEENKRFESLPIRTRLSDDEVAKFVARRYRFPGVDIRARLFRQYPEGAFASHLLGHIGRISERDLERIDSEGATLNYRGTEYFGKSGLERHYEFALHGISGFEQVEVDAAGRPVRSLARVAPVAGNNLTLTVDSKLQRVAEQAFGDRRGALVAIEPATGGILALVSMPNYDPNLFVDGISSQDWNELNNSPDKPMVNRALNGTYPPGSTFKPFMALAALATGKRRPEQAFADPGFFNFGGHVFRDNNFGGHGLVDLRKSIVESRNTYYYQLAADLGIDAISRFMAQFGFGQRTGVDIAGESEGVLPSQEWKRKRFRKPEQQRWYAGETISVGIGQGYNSYTPIQLAQATATLANDGVMFRPHLVQHIADTRTGKKTWIEPEPPKTIPLKAEHLRVVKEAMAGVTTEGTGARVFKDAGYASAGKTGTAQVFSLRGEKYVEDQVAKELRNHSLYIAFAPVDQPTIALAVLVENGGFGSQAAAPIARQVFDYYLLGKLPAGAAPENAAGEESIE